MSDSHQGYKSDARPRLEAELNGQADGLPVDPAELAELVLGPAFGFRTNSEEARLARRVPNPYAFGFQTLPDDDDDSEEEK